MHSHKNNTSINFVFISPKKLWILFHDVFKHKNVYFSYSSLPLCLKSQQNWKTSKPLLSLGFVHFHQNAIHSQGHLYPCFQKHHCQGTAILKVIIEFLAFTSSFPLWISQTHSKYVSSIITNKFREERPWHNHLYLLQSPQQSNFTHSSHSEITWREEGRTSKLK